MVREHRSLILVLFFFLILLIVGTAGYVVLLQVSILDAFYMTVITIATVGFREVAELSDAAKIFTVFIIFAGLGFVGYALTSLVAFLTEGQLQTVWRRRRMDNRIRALHKHYIVCGAGETAQNVMAQLSAGKVPFVVVDLREEKIHEFHNRGILAIHGDPTHESALEQANIHNAEGLICALSSDTENVFTILTARYLNPKLYIISRAIEPHAHEKLRMAGADRTISPNEIGGRRMAAMVLRPSIFSFLDVVTYAGDEVFNLEEVLLGEASELNGKTLREARIPELTGLIVMAIKKSGSRTMVFNPQASETIATGDSLIVLGNPENVDKLKTLAKDEGIRLHL
ncbi:MAG: potassium channel protein [Eubacteriales bacterium]|nr:potassium channel protein [Eubacteriales bacterium]